MATGCKKINNKCFTKYRAMANENFKTYILGTFETEERASLSYRLFKLWLSKGFKAATIPTYNKTKDAI